MKFYPPIEYNVDPEANPTKVILQDIKMPEGVQVLREVKTDSARMWIPGLTQTTSTDKPGILEWYEPGANGYVIKPVERNKIVDVVTQLKFFWLTLNQQSQ